MVKEMKTYRVIGGTVTVEDIKECVRICKDENICIRLECERKIIITEYTNIDELAKRLEIENKE